MFKDYFIAAARHVSSQGFLPQIGELKPFDTHEIERFEKAASFEVPTELRQFYLEMGNHFGFQAHSDQSGFSVSSLYDLQYSKDFFQELADEVAHGLGQENPRNAPELLKAEAERRKNWFPFYNIGGGGYLLCLDLSKDPAPVCYHESVYWVYHDPSVWSFELASSFTDLLIQWSKFSFSDPGGDITSFCMDRAGKFDWSPEHFDPRFRITA